MTTTHIFKLTTNSIWGLLALFALLTLHIPKIMAKQTQDIKIVFLGESSSKDAVWLYRVERMKLTAEKLHLNFSYRFAEGDYEQHAKMIEEEVNNGADAIIIPLWNPTLYNQAIEYAVAKGVYIYGMLGISPTEKLPAEIVNKLGWAQTNWHEFGKRLALISLDQKSEKILWPAEIATGTYITEALAGFKEVYAKKGIPISIDLVEVGFDIKNATKKIKYYLSIHSDVKTIITSGAIAIDAANRAVKEIGKMSNDISLYGQVISPKSVQGIIEGYMAGGVNLELTRSSEEAILDVVNVISKGAKPSRKYVGFTEVNKQNVTKVVPLSFLKNDD